MKIALYAHGGSGNHGCEALVRSTIKALGPSHQYSLFSEKPIEDEKYGLDKIAVIRPTQTALPSKGLSALLYKIQSKISHNDKIYYQYLYRKFLNNEDKFDMALAIGGDNYCYTGFLERFSIQNKIWKKHHIPIGLWGCSIDPERINSSLLKDLRKYEFITARESLTYEALKTHSLKNVYLIPDTAFLLDSLEQTPPNGFQENNTVGINISPLVIRQEVKPGIVMRNLEFLIEKILSNTDMSVALIPHVVWKGNDDRDPLSYLYEKYRATGRVLMIEDNNSTILKGYIKRCRFLIAARTHASIAGYSSAVPTLVIGYSIKSKGIATDIFGTDDRFVIPIQSIENDNTICYAFQWLQFHETEIYNKNAVFLHSYYQNFNQIGKLIQDYEKK